MASQTTKKNKSVIFSEKIYAALPLTYRFLKGQAREENGELLTKKRFSKSEPHQCTNYLTTGLYKPTSNLDPYCDITAQEEVLE